MVVEAVAGGDMGGTQGRPPKQQMLHKVFINDRDEIDVVHQYRLNKSQDSSLVCLSQRSGRVLLESGVYENAKCCNSDPPLRSLQLKDPALNSGPSDKS